jgi:hypothetical protein
MPKNAHPDSTFSSFLQNDWTQLQTGIENTEYPQPDIRGAMPKNAHPDSTFSSHLHNDWTQVQTGMKNSEYPQPDIRGPMPKNAHPDSTFSSFLHNDWTLAQIGEGRTEYPSPDIRGPMPQNAHPDSTFSSHLHNDWTYVQNKEYPSPDIRGPMPKNAHPDSTFSSHLHNDWTQLQLSESESESSSDDEDVQLGGIDAFTPVYSDTEAQGGYSRVVPSRFSEERDDTLMKSLIQNYAIEMKNKAGKPTGFFFFDKSAALAASTEVCTTHAPKSAAELLGQKFEDTWTHFDVNKDGLVEVERMPQFLRYLTGNALEIGL